MNKKMRELRQEIVDKKTEARQLADENKITEAKAMLEEIKSLEEKFDIEAALFEEEKQVDWIEDALKNKTGELFDTIDYWGVYVCNLFSDYVSEVIIETREVF